jgi:hypothetical protein
MKPDWTAPADIRNEVERLWSSGRILATRLDDSKLFPYALRLRRPDPGALTARFDDVRKWIRTLEQASKSATGFGYDIEWTEINHRQLGRNRLPARLSVATETDAVRLIEKDHEAKCFAHLTDATLVRFPVLAGWLARHPLIALAHAANWDRVLDVLTWFRNRPRPGLYLRQLDIHGVHTKFIELRKGLLAELLDAVLPPDGVDPRFIGAANFEQRYGLAVEPVLVRFRLLDPRLRFQGFSDLTVPAAEFARLRIDTRTVFITENKINGLAFPEMTDALVIFGLGNSLARLSEAEWLQTKALYYWGDIDTHGFAILDRLRAVFPHAVSFLMDRTTLLAHQELWVTEHERFDGLLTRLNVTENALFEAIKRDDLADHVRLEQERISFGWVKQALKGLLELAPPGGP